MNAVPKPEKSESYSALQPWWEKMGIYFGITLTIIAGVAVTGLGFKQLQLSCVLTDNNPKAPTHTQNITFILNSTNLNDKGIVSKLATPQYAYVNKKCLQSLDSYTLYLPWFLVLYSAFLMVLANGWAYLPAARARMDAFYMHSKVMLTPNYRLFSKSWDNLNRQDFA